MLFAGESVNGKTCQERERSLKNVHTCYSNNFISRNLSLKKAKKSTKMDITKIFNAKQLEIIQMSKIRAKTIPYSSH